jgi:hypothetical protein
MFGINILARLRQIESGTDAVIPGMLRERLVLAGNALGHAKLFTNTVFKVSLQLPHKVEVVDSISV